MIVLGLLLIVLGGLAIVLRRCSAPSRRHRCSSSAPTSARAAIFLLGVGRRRWPSCWGFSIIKFGSQARSWPRREEPRAAGPAEKLDSARTRRASRADAAPTGEPTPPPTTSHRASAARGPARASAERSAVWPSQCGPATVTCSRTSSPRPRSRRRARRWPGRPWPRPTHASSPEREPGHRPARPGRPRTGRRGGRAPSRRPRPSAAPTSTQQADHRDHEQRGRAPLARSASRRRPLLVAATASACRRGEGR